MPYLQINDIIVDVSRGYIHKHGQIQTLEPRVVEVLVLLARHQGEVVTHQTLMREIWTNTVVEANALQRCIGQLRKAFDDNDRKLIATFPRKGYSLTEPVCWHDNLPGHHANGRALRFNFSSSPLLATGISAFVLAGLLLLINALFNSDADLTDTRVLANSPDNTTRSYSELQGANSWLPANLVRSDFFAVYAPDSFMVAYPRSESSEGSQLWLRNVLNGNEIRLTEHTGNFHYSAWSPNSKQLAYIQEHECYSLHIQSVDQDSETGIITSSPETLLECRPLLLSPQWLDENTLALIEADTDEQTTVVSLIDVTSGDRQIIYRQPDSMPYHISYSAEMDSLAVAQLSEENLLELVLLSPATGSGELLYSAETNLEKGSVWHPVWNQHGTEILVSKQGRTLNIALDGTVSEQVVPFISSQH